MKPYGATKQWNKWADYVRKTDEVSANPRLKNARKRLSKSLKVSERKNNKISTSIWIDK